MESALSTLGFVIFGLWISIYAIVVESNRINVGSELSSSTSPHSHSPSRSPTAVLPPPVSPPKPKRNPPPSHSPNERKKHGRKIPPPPPPLMSPPSPPPPPQSPPPSSDLKPHLNAPVPKQQSGQMNAGKALGLLFLGMAAVMQIVVVGFLIFKRRLLLKTKDIYETGS